MCVSVCGLFDWYTVGAVYPRGPPRELLYHGVRVGLDKCVRACLEECLESYIVLYISYMRACCIVLHLRFVR